MFLAIDSIGYDNILLTKVIADITMTSQLQSLTKWSDDQTDY